MAKKQENFPAGKPPSKAGSADKQPATDSGVDRIREILFGTQMEGYAGRFAGLEKSLQVATETLSAEISSEVARLEKEMVGKNSDLNGQLAESRRALQEESARLASQHEQDTRKLADQISQLQATLDHKIEDLAAKFDKATTALHKQMQAQHVDLLNTLDARIRELSSVKADRATLATLLTDLAGNLTAESGSREVK